MDALKYLPELGNKSSRLNEWCKDKLIEHEEYIKEYGQDVELSNKDGSIEKIKCIGNVPFGHKIAYKEIKKGEKIIKYGECIGGALCDIKKGEYVHVHNLEALRGRGDK